MAMPTPAAFVNDATTARQLAARGKLLRQRGRLAPGIDDDQRARLEAEGKALLRESEERRIRANTSQSGLTRRWRAQLSHGVDRARRVDAHSVSQLVMSELTLADPLFSEPDHSIPQAPGKPAPLEYFSRFFGDLTFEWRLGRAPGVARHRLFWKPLTPCAPDDPSVTAPVSPVLIYCIVFPLTKRFRPARCCDGPCRACDRLLAAWTGWRPDDPHSTTPQPSFKPSLRASRAAGPDGLLCEDVRWARPGELDERHNYRMWISTLFAAYVNRILTEGRVPDNGFADCVSTPVFKHGKPGQPKPDPAEPNNYRDITVGQFLAKLVSLVLTFRLSHWALRHSMISPEQVAFMPYHSAESHVFAFSQLLRSRARSGLCTRALYVDLEKAYNRVHLASLWCLLRQMNVPAIIVDLLDDWATKRRTRLRVNGELSPEYSMLAGTPQGDPLSCLLFNLYIEPLIRYINSLESIHGVPIPGLAQRVKAFFFADDMVGLSGLSPDDSQAIMDAVMRWCNDWDMKASTTVGKTETNSYGSTSTRAAPITATPFVDSAAGAGEAAAAADDADLVPSPWGPWKVEKAAAAAAAANPGLVRANAERVVPGPVTITESDSYRYLGLRMHVDLSDRLATSHIITTMDRLHYRYFTFNLTIRRCSPTLQLQLLHSNVFGPVIYLLSILSVDSSIRSKFDRRARRFGRHVFGLPRTAPNSVVTGLTRFISFDALQGRERARLQLQLSDPLLPTSIAHAIFTGVLLEPRGRRLSHANMPARHVANLARLEDLGVAPPPAHPPPYRVAIEAGLHGDRIALQQWQHEARVASGVPDPLRADRPRRDGSAALQPRPASLRLPRPLPLDHAADIYFNFSQPIGVGPLRHGLVPLSYLGAGGTSIPALSNRQHQVVAIVARLHTGNIALRRHPWRPRNPVRPPAGTGTGIEGADDELSDDDTVASGSSDSADDDDGRDYDTESDCTSSASSGTPNHWRRRASHRDAPAGRPATAPSRARSQSTAPSYAQGPDQPRAAALACRLCGHGHEHPAHAFLECTAERLPELRRALLVDAHAAWKRLLTRIEDATMSEYKETIPDAPIARAALEIAYSAADSTEACWLTYRLLWAIPWPADAVPTSAAAARAIGAIFDQTVLSRHASRPLADTWVSWASKWTKKFGALWGELLRGDADLSDTSPSPPAAARPDSPAPSPQTDPFLPSSQSTGSMDE